MEDRQGSRVHCLGYVSEAAIESNGSEFCKDDGRKGSVSVLLVRWRSFGMK